MPPAAKRDCGVILFDVNASNRSFALKALLKICTYHWLSENRDAYKFILANTKSSKNALNFLNLEEINISNLEPPRVISSVEDAEPVVGNWLEGILLGIHHLKDLYEAPGVITLQILLISNLEPSFNNIEDQKVQKIIAQLKKYQIHLYIIGPEVKMPYIITSNDDIYECMQEISVDEPSASLDAAQKIVKNTDYSVMCNLKMGIHLFFAFRNPRGTKPWNVPLSFGTQLEIPVCTVKVYKRQQPFKLTPKEKKNMYVLEEDETVQVDFSDLVPGIKRHKKFVRIEDNQLFKVDGPRCFSVIGFTQKECVPEYYMRGEGTYYVLPDPDKIADGCQAFYTLIDVLSEKNKYAIVKRVYNNNNKPKFFVLVPRLDLETKCFMMADLPYADDVKYITKFKDPKLIVKEEEEADDFKKFFDSLDVWNVQGCKTTVPLAPTMTLDGYLVGLACEAAKKHVERDFDFQEININDVEMLETNEFLEDVKKSWVQDIQKDD